MNGDARMRESPVNKESTMAIIEFVIVLDVVVCTVWIEVVSCKGVVVVM